MIKVLDHGFVRLVSYMQPVSHMDYANGGIRNEGDEASQWTGDLEVVRNARVSYNADWRSGEDENKDEKLIYHMMRGGHSSPFEAMVFTFEVKAPIFVFHSFVANNLVVHNSYNELSARYQELDEEFYVPDPAVIGQQSKTDKQAREVINNASGGNLEVDMSNAIRDTCQAAFQTYKLLLSTGCPRELARGVLPVNTYSRMFATVDLHNLFHFLRLRLDKHAQWEIQQYAYALCDLIRPIVPISFEAFVKKRIYDGRE